MLTSLKLGFAEIKRFTGGVMPKLVLASLAIIPLLYGGVYLYSNWDPYGSVDHVTGALVMEDAGATKSDGTRMDTGQQVADDLKKSGDFDWKDVSTRDEAKSQVESGEADFALVIPKDFSENLLSTSRFAPDKNGKTGTVDPQRAGLEVITNDANNYILTNIVTKAGTTIRDKVASQVGDETANQLLASFTTIHGKMQEATDGSKKVDDGAVNLSDAVTRLKNGTASLHDGAITLNDGAGTLAQAEQKLLNGNDEAVSGSQQVDSGAKKLSSGASELAQGTHTLYEGTGKLKDGTSELKSGAGTLADGAGKLKSGTDTLAQGASSLSDGASQLDSKLQDSGLNTAAADLDQVCKDLSAANGGTSTGRLGTDVADAAVAQAGQKTRAALQQYVDDGTMTSKQVDAIVEKVSGEQAKKDAATVTAKGLDDLESGGPAAALAKFRSSSCASNGTSELSGQIKQLTGAVSQLSSGAKKVSDGATTVDSSTAALASGASTLATGATTLDQKTGELRDGAKKVDDGAQTLDSGTTTLAQGTGSLASGAKELRDGQAQAKDGADQLADGTEQAVQGSQQVDEGTGKVKNGSSELRDGTKDLNQGLSDGTKQVPNLNKDQRSSLSSVMSDPVSDDHNSLANGRNYGEGMGPFFMVLALWIGALMTGQFLRARSSRAAASNASDVKLALGTWIPWMLISVLQTVVLFAVVRFGLGFQMEHPWGVFGLLLLASITFSALAQGLISLLGAPGKLLVLILLILQLVTAGGMMPYETLPQSIRWLHHVLPMGYALTGIRRMAYGIDEGSVLGIAALLVGFMLLGLLFGLIGARRSRTWTLSTLDPEVNL